MTTRQTRLALAALALLAITVVLGLFVQQALITT